MMVSAMADKAAEGGGIGLSELILKAMLPPTPHGKPDLSQSMGALQGVQHSDASASGVDPLDRLASAVSENHVSLNRMSPNRMTPSGAFPIEAGQPATGLPGGSARLGAPSQVLTEARPARMLPSTAAGQQASPTRPGGATR
jgi:hypothetical protein